MNDMRILNVITALGVGGAENMLIDVCRELKLRGHEQRVIYLRPPEDYVESFRNEGIEVNCIGEGKSFVSSVLEIRRQIKAFSPDVVHTHLPAADTIARMAALFHGKSQLFTTIHNADRWKESKKLSHRLLRAFNRFTVNCFSRVHLIACSNSVREYCIRLEKILPKKIETIENFVDFDTSAKRSEHLTKEDLGFQKDDFVVISIGRLTEQKRQIHILEATNKLIKQDVTNIGVIILGEGEERKNLQEYIDEHGLTDFIKLLGAKPNVYDYMDIADVCVFSSEYEGFSITLLEAMLNEVPIICTDIPSFRDIIEDGKNGVLYPFGNTEALTEKMRTAKAGEYDLTALAENAKRRISHNNRTEYVDKLLAAYSRAENHKTK